VLFDVRVFFLVSVLLTPIAPAACMALTVSIPNWRTTSKDLKEYVPDVPMTKLNPKKACKEFRYDSSEIQFFD